VIVLLTKRPSTDGSTEREKDDLSNCTLKGLLHLWVSLKIKETAKLALIAAKVTKDSVREEKISKEVYF